MTRSSPRRPADHDPASEDPTQHPTVSTGPVTTDQDSGGVDTQRPEGTTAHLSDHERHGSQQGSHHGCDSAGDRLISSLPRSGVKTVRGRTVAVMMDRNRPSGRRLRSCRVGAAGAHVGTRRQCVRVPGVRPDTDVDQETAAFIIDAGLDGTLELGFRDVGRTVDDEVGLGDVLEEASRRRVVLHAFDGLLERLCGPNKRQTLIRLLRHRRGAWVAAGRLRGTISHASPVGSVRAEPHAELGAEVPPS
jgi:hypothetical protein